MSSSRLAAILVSLIVLSSCTTNPHGAQTVPMHESIFIGSVVAAGPQQSPQPDTAIYVTDGLVREVGPASTIRTAHPKAKVFESPDATILPGLVDAHGHLYGLGLSLDTVNVVGVNTYDEVVSRMKDRAAKSKAGEWILGRGWDQNLWPGKQFPTAAPLDAAIPDHPVWIRRVDGHAGVANSAAMRAAGVTAATPDPEGGRIIRDSAGNPTGTFVDDAMQLIDSKVPAPSFETRKARVLAAAQNIAANGLTGMHDAGTDAETLRAIQTLIDEKKFPIRVYSMLTDDPELLNKWIFRQKPLIDYRGHLTVRAVKLYADGALGSRGAALIEPYSDEPGNKGLFVTRTQHIVQVAGNAHDHGYQVCTHAIGDAAVRNVIDAYESAGVQPSDRFRIEHFQVVAPSDFARTAKDGIIASVQPTHATSDMPWAEARVGAKRIRGAYAWRTTLNAGARLALGSDFPVEFVNPFFGIYSAVTRQDHNGQPLGGWYADEKLTLPEALRGFTLDAAYAAFEENVRGTIEPGKAADFTIVEGNFFTKPVSELWKTKVRATVVGGMVVYSAK